LSAYESEADPLYYAMRFVDGLKEEIKSMVKIQHPATLDAACALALVQEEAADSIKKKDHRRGDSGFNRSFSRFVVSGHAPVMYDKPIVLPPPDDKRTTEVARAGSAEDKMRALRQYRRARGLCDHCAEKWVNGHKCAPTVQLQAIQELMQLFPDDGSESTDSFQTSPDELDSQLYMALSEAAILGVESAKSMKFVGKIQGHDMLILLDSGSFHTFLRAELASKLTGVTSLQKGLSVQVANGNQVSCKSQLQGLELCSSIKILPLDHYDMILGYDWLEKHSPMKVHWQDRWIAIPYGTTTQVIQGVLSAIQPRQVVQVLQLSGQDLLQEVPGLSEVIENVPPEIQKLSQFSDVFATKVSYRPTRPFYHSIPLLPGARPVHIGPYRYAPHLKDEIEAQVQDMLDNGLIQHSSNPYSSPVLLVKKKGETYRFCVDFRRLNAITRKGQFPVPIIDEFLDELKEASWFSTLDLCSGFHQIPMHPDDCEKTAFQAHNGQFEFRVMPFVREYVS
jgi:hypothetical protein